MTVATKWFKSLPKRKSSEPTATKAPTASALGQNGTVRHGGRLEGFAQGMLVLDEYASLTPTNHFHTVMVAVKTEHFFKLVVESWEQLRALQFKASQQFSLAEWLHVHALFLYGRIQQVKRAHLGNVEDPQLGSPLNHIKFDASMVVFLPIWSALACIGLVNDPELYVRYVPDAVMPHSQSQYSAEELAHILSGTLYDWNRSWNRVLEARYKREIKRPGPEPRSSGELMQAIWKLRRTTASSQHIHLDTLIQEIRDARDYTLHPPFESDSENDGVDKPIMAAVEAAANNIAAQSPVAEGTRTLDPDRGSTYSSELDFNGSARTSANTTSATAATTPPIDEEGKDIFRGYDSPSSIKAPVYTDCYVHYDAQLWAQYQDFVAALSDSARFARMPESTDGSSAWLFPIVRGKRSEPLKLRLPRASVHRREQVMALILQTSNVSPEISQAWHVESEITADVRKLVEAYVLAGLQRGR